MKAPAQLERWLDALRKAGLKCRKPNVSTHAGSPVLLCAALPCLARDVPLEPNLEVAAAAATGGRGATTTYSVGVLAGYVAATAPRWMGRRRSVFLSACAVPRSDVGPERAAPPDRRLADWPLNGRDPGGMRYSPLAQITRDNVKQLRIAWTYRTGEADAKRVSASLTAFEATPLVIGRLSMFVSADGMLYGTFTRRPAVGPEHDVGRWHITPEGRFCRTWHVWDSRRARCYTLHLSLPVMYRGDESFELAVTDR